MLSRLDETLRHQLPTTFDHVGTSDPRFFDRYWFCCYDPAGSLALNVGMGLYNNMNVLDGYIALQVPNDGEGTRQHNFRFSRSLRPRIDDTAVGPLSIEIVEPFREARIVVSESDRPIAADLTWRAFLHPKEESPHYRRVRGRVSQDYRRYTQVGRMTGSVTFHGTRHDVAAWFSARDHSWGVRPQTAGPEPVTGPPEARPAGGSVFFWLPFATDTFGGHLQIHTQGDGRQSYLDGIVQWPDGREADVVEASFEVDMHPGTRRWRQVRTRLVDEHGETYAIVADQLLRDWSMDGTGYDWGWNDGLGLGVWRGDEYEESDVFDLTHPERVVRPDGEERTPNHREAPARVTVNGAPGTGHQIVIASGSVPFLGLA
jgi:hypothetical protein